MVCRGRAGGSFSSLTGWAACRGFLVCVFALVAILDDQTDSLFDADPMVLLCDRRRRFVDAAVRFLMDQSGDLVLLLGIADHFFIFEH